MFRNAILCFCLITSPVLIRASTYEPIPEQTEKKECETESTDERLTWKKVLLGIGVVVIGVVTFVLVGKNNNK